MVRRGTIKILHMRSGIVAISRPYQRGPGMSEGDLGRYVKGVR